MPLHLEPRRYYTTGRVARVKGCDPDTVLAACREGRLRSIPGYDVNDNVGAYLVRGDHAMAWDQPRPRAPKRKSAGRA